MPVTEQVQEAVSNNRSAALTAAAAAATGAAATLAVRKARGHNGSSSPGEALRNVTRGRSGASNILASAAESSWEAAADVLIPMAENAAESAGKYVAKNAPDVIRDRIIPKFIEAFEEAR